MPTATTTCSFSVPKLYNGATPTSTAQHWNYGSSTCSLAISSSTQVSVVNGFTYGEIVITVLLFLIFCSQFFWPLWGWIRGIKIKPR